MPASAMAFQKMNVGLFTRCLRHPRDKEGKLTHERGTFYLTHSSTLRRASASHAHESHRVQEVCRPQTACCGKA
jgi:hypothetical protein